MVFVLPPETKPDSAQLAAAGVAVLVAYKLLQWWRSPAAKTCEDAKIRTVSSTLPVIGNMLDAMKNGHCLHDWISKNCNELQGQLWRLKIPSRADVVIVSTPAIMEDITKTHFESFVKGDYQRDWLRDYLGDGIFSSDGDRWVHQRKTAARFFSARLLREHMATCIQKNALDVYRVLDKAVQAGEALDLQQLFKEFAIQSFAEMGFGIHLNCVGASEEHPFQAAMDTATRVLSLRFRRPVVMWKLLRWLDVGEEAELRRSVKIIDDAVYKMAQQSIDATYNPAVKDAKKNGTYKAKSVMELFLQAVESESMNTIKLEDLRDFALVFVVAGRDTTADTFTWFFYLVSQHPEVERKIREELTRKLPEIMNGTRREALTTDDIVGLVYLEAAIKETLRLYPLPPLNIRECAQDTVLSNGALVRKGELVGLATFAMGRNPLVWGEDAAAYRPERWIDAETLKLKTVTSFKFIAFHAGPRSCLGESLAMLELKLLIVNLFARYKFDVLPGNDGAYEMSMSMSMKQPLLARVNRA